MRITSGKLRGRTFNEPPGHKTHPMSEKIRSALFNSLGNIENLSVLDAFAGSGALAFEAASRGAKKVIAVEKDTSAYKITERSLKDLDLSAQVSLVRANVGGWSDHNMEKKFDILLLDPPYARLQFNLIQKLLNRHIKKGSLAVLSYPGHIAVPDFERVEVISDKKYGDAQLVFYRKKH